MHTKTAMLETLNNYLKPNNYLNNKLSQLQREQLIDYIILLQKWNKTHNLTAIKDPLEMITKHILDSLVVAEYIEEFNNIIDVGTGAGLPGIPLAIIFPNKKFTLLDSLQKRISFLQVVKSSLKLANITPIKSRVEDYKSQFDCIISRAFTNTNNMLNLCNHLLMHNGYFCPLKANLEDDMNIDISKYKLCETIELQVPGLGSHVRHLLKISIL